MVKTLKGVKPSGRYILAWHLSTGIHGHLGAPGWPQQQPAKPRASNKLRERGCALSPTSPGGQSHLARAAARCLQLCSRRWRQSRCPRALGISIPSWFTSALRACFVCLKNSLDASEDQSVPNDHSRSLSFKMCSFRRWIFFFLILWNRLSSEDTCLGNETLNFNFFFILWCSKTYLLPSLRATGRLLADLRGGNFTPPFHFSSSPDVLKLCH